MVIRLNLRDGAEISITHIDNPNIFYIIKAEKGKIIQAINKKRLETLRGEGRKWH